MQYTENYQFRKPVIGVDDADVKDINFNSDRADTLIHNTQISLAPAYDLNETYNTGDVVMYETLMYKCKEDNVTGAWVPEKWERTTAGEEGSGGGGGSSVVPNPQGSPTDTLETIEIDGTVYDIAGSGGGGGSTYTETVLYENTGTSAGNITLSDDLNNYDMLMFVVVRTIGVGRELIELPFMTSDLTVGTHITLISYASEYINYDVTSMTLLTRTNSQSNYVEKVKGIKFGGGNGSEIISISAGDGTTSRTFTFNKTPKSVQFYWDDPVLEGTGWIGNGSFVWGQEYITFPAHTRASSVTGMMGGCAVLSYGADGKSVTINGANAFQSLNTPNGSGFIFVDYGGGSGGARKDILYNNPSGAPTGTYLALTHNFRDYDEIYMKISNGIDISNFNLYVHVSFMPMMYEAGEKVSVQALYGQRVVDIVFDGATFNVIRVDGDFSNTIYEIVGIKY